MPIPSPFHERTSKLCTSFRWKDWSGYAAVCSFDTTHDREYFAFRESAGLLDVSPLFKYEVYGPDAAALLSRMMVRDVSKLKVGRVGYSCWCDDHGKVIDDGTVTRWDEDYYRVTAADPTLHWLQAVGRGMRVSIAVGQRSNFEESFRSATGPDPAVQAPWRDVDTASVRPADESVEHLGRRPARLVAEDVVELRPHVGGESGLVHPRRQLVARRFAGPWVVAGAAAPGRAVGDVVGRHAVSLRAHFYPVNYGTMGLSPLRVNAPHRSGTMPPWTVPRS